MAKQMISCEIKMGNDRTTLVHGNNIDEVIKKIEEFHTLGKIERDYFTNKGTLSAEIESGWYIRRESQSI